MLGVGAVEAWIVFPRSRRFGLHGASTLLAESAFPVDLAGLFDRTAASTTPPLAQRSIGVP